MNRMELSRLMICAGVMAALAMVACAPTAANVTISGYVRDVNAVGMSGVTVRASGGTAATTASNGAYSLSVASGWSGMVGPEGLYMFQPTSYTYTAITTDQPNQDFTASPQQFEHRSTSINNISRGAIAWGDFDNNGVMDVAVAGYEFDQRHNTLAPGTRIWRNDGAANFTNVSAGLTGVQDAALAWGDYDNDGKLDLIMAGDTGTTYVTKLYHNAGATWPVNTGAVLPGVKNGSVAWGDYDNDGFLDLLIAGNSASGRITKLFHNNGNATFTEAAGVSLPGISHCSVAWADYDSDGRLDFAIAGATDSASVTRIYHNDGASQFSDISAGLTGVACASLAWVDYDNDGKLDLAFAGERADAVKITRICRNTGTAFLEQDLGIPGVKGSIAWGDYDNDGKPDLAIVGPQGSSNSPKACRNNGNGTFTIYPVTVTDVGLINTALAWGDYDNDGKLDLIVSGDTNNGYPGMFLYQNKLTVANTVPSAPSGLATTFEDNTLTLSWSASTDTQTPQSGLCYNIRVGTTPGAGNTFTGMADYSTGGRLLPALGNAQKNLTWVIRNLPPRAYYWSVQAIDTALAGSAWAQEAMVRPPTIPPTISIGAPSTSLTNVGPVTYVVTYEGADSITLASADVTLNTTGTTSGTVAVSGTGTVSRTVTLSGITGSGTLGISIAAGTASNIAEDLAPEAGPSGIFSVDNIAPTISVSAPSGSITRGDPISYTVTYDGNDAVALASGHVTLNKTGTANGTVSVSGTGLTTRTASISDITGDGTLGISIAAATASDSAGNTAPVAGPSATFTVDNTGPAVTIGAPSASTTAGGPVTYEITYADAAAITLASGDVSLDKTGTADGTIAVTGTDLTTRTVTISDITGDGTLGIMLAAGTAADSLGNMALASGPSDPFTVDNTGPTVSIGAPSASITKSGPVSYEIAYDGADTITLADGDVTLDHTGTATGTIAVTGTGLTTRTVTISGIAGDGTLGVSIAAGTAGDNSGHTAPAAGPSGTFSVDNTSPTAVTVSLNPTITSGADVVASFSGSTDANGVIYKLKVDGGVYTTLASPNSVVVTSLNEGIHAVYVKAVDPAGNESAEASALFTYDKTVPIVHSVSFSPMLLAGGDPVSITVTATDNFGLTAVTANGIALTNSFGDLWTGTITAASPAGSHSVDVVAYDAAANSTPFDSQYFTVPAVGLNGRFVADPIMMMASGSFVFTVWGKVSVIDRDSFLLDDGSGKPIMVNAVAHGLADNDYASARGTLDISSNPPLLSAHIVRKRN